MDSQKILELLGELVVTEIDDLNNIIYSTEYDVMSFVMKMENGKRFRVKVEEIKR